MLRRVNHNLPRTAVGCALLFAAGFIDTKPWPEVPSIADSFCRTAGHFSVVPENETAHVVPCGTGLP